MVNISYRPLLTKRITPPSEKVIETLIPIPPFRVGRSYNCRGEWDLEVDERGSNPGSVGLLQILETTPSGGFAGIPR